MSSFENMATLEVEAQPYAGFVSDFYVSPLNRQSSLVITNYCGFVGIFPLRFLLCTYSATVSIISKRLPMYSKSADSYDTFYVSLSAC